MTAEEFIQRHREDDVRALALKGGGDSLDMAFCLRQIEGWQVARKKLPRWTRTDGVLYPPRLSMEQCSSEQTALYKRGVVERLLPDVADRRSMTDLTGGFGIDFSYMATSFADALYVERQEELCHIVEHNLPLLGVHNARVKCAEAEDVLSEIEECSLVYLDPARRDGDGRKVVALADCSPDVTCLYDKLLEKAPYVMVKLSPMLDIHQALESLPSVKEVHVVSVCGECKELLLVISREVEDVTFHCVNMAGSVEAFVAKPSSVAPQISQDVKGYLYEPNASILKAGVQDALCDVYGVAKLHPFSHLFVSEELVEGFPGRTFRVTDMSDFGKAGLRRLMSDVDKANLTVRNFPSSVAELRKKWKLKEGGAVYFFATTLSSGTHALIKCEKV